MVYVQTASEVPGQAAVYSATTNFTAPAGPARRLLVSTMIHIGFGDSHLITMPNTGKRFLYDSGGRDADQSVSGYLQQHGITSVDVMLGTHEHADHMGGLVGSSFSGTDGVVSEFPPDFVYDSAVKTDASRFVYTELLTTLAAAGAQRVVLSRGQTSLNVPELQLDPEVLIQVLNSGVPPDYVPGSHEDTNINNDSMVLRFTYGDVDFIIGGDCEFGCENSILGAFPASALEVEYFKATHHGLGDANGATWVATLLPRVAFIPNTEWVWDPPYEFEGAISSTTTKLLGVGAHIYAIDEARSLGRPRHDSMGGYDGRQYNVSFVTDGRSYEVRIERAMQTAPRLTAQEAGCIAHTHAALAPGGTQH
jgi:competence protein ComEC